MKKTYEAPEIDIYKYSEITCAGDILSTPDTNVGGDGTDIWD